ncbi:MAG TPA: tripartite tricarboxylate transporter substrate binding protein [Ramlibacter sp.]|nr:tripartite tricarboxylate transporter substrate binding protein [Ramlibacter sp.]
MTAPTRIHRRTILAFALAGALPTAAWAAYPDKPVKLVVPFPPGGAGDLMARGLAQRLSTELGQQVVIDNRGGAGGAVACEAVARSPADGYTLLFGTLGTHAINPALYAKLRYDPVKDFAPVALTHLNPRVLVVGPSLKVQTVAELVQQAKANPKKFTYGSAGSGSTGHLAGALFESMAGVDLVHVPYKGSAPLLTDLLAGRIDATFDSLTVYEEHMKSGKVRALAVTSGARMSALPQVPTLAESGLPGYDVSNWLGVFAPAGTPREVVQALHAGIVKAMADPAMRKQLGAVGIEAKLANPEEFAALLRADIPKWAKVVKTSGAQVE